MSRKHAIHSKSFCEVINYRDQLNQVLKGFGMQTVAYIAATCLETWTQSKAETQKTNRLSNLPRHIPASRSHSNCVVEPAVGIPDLSKQKQPKYLKMDKFGSCRAYFKISSFLCVFLLGFPQGLVVLAGV